VRKKLTTTEIYTQVSIKKLKEIHTATHPARAKRERPGDGKKADQGHDKIDQPKPSP
jgi:integrase/recombinase XerD